MFADVLGAERETGGCELEERGIVTPVALGADGEVAERPSLRAGRIAIMQYRPLVRLLLTRALQAGSESPGNPRAGWSS